jgi:hypothetical protein
MALGGQCEWVQPAAFAPGERGMERQPSEAETSRHWSCLWFEPREQMLARQVTLAQVLEVLRKGAVVEPPHQHLRTNDWRCTLERRVAGDLVRVACAVHRKATGEVVVVVTVMRAHPSRPFRCGSVTVGRSNRLRIGSCACSTPSTSRAMCRCASSWSSGPKPSASASRGRAS